MHVNHNAYEPLGKLLYGLMMNDGIVFIYFLMKKKNPKMKVVDLAEVARAKCGNTSLPSP